MVIISSLFEMLHFTFFFISESDNLHDGSFDLKLNKSPFKVFSNFFASSSRNRKTCVAVSLAR